MKPVYVDAIGLNAPGLVDWPGAQAVLRGEQAWTATDPGATSPQLLPPNERRRATASVRLAFRVAEEACARSAYPPDQLAGVFASSEGDTGILHRLCTALAEPARQVSPTEFHNSVHNAAGGYWSIAAQSRHPSISLSAFDASFCAGLLEACTYAAGESAPVLFVCYDIVPPQPLLAVRPITQPFGVALILSPSRGDRSLARLSLSATRDAETTLADTGLEALRRSNPAARALPLLQSLAMKAAKPIILESTGDQRWRVDVEPA